MGRRAPADRLTTAAVSAQYDAIAAQYRRSKQAPLRRYVESWTFMSLIGDVTGMSVLDLACGEGFYTRRLKALGADRVAGVDISPEMIRLAESDERGEPLGIEYICAPAQTMPDLGPFDLVAAAYLLHYAADAAELELMCRRIAGHLRPGGRFVALCENPGQTAGDFRGYEPYGFSKTASGPLRDGATIHYSMIAGRELFEFEVRYFRRETYERILRSAGFCEIHWHPMRLDPAGARALGDDYWRAYLENPPVVALECRT